MITFFNKVFFLYVNTDQGTYIEHIKYDEEKAQMDFEFFYVHYKNMHL